MRQHTTPSASSFGLTFCAYPKQSSIGEKRRLRQECRARFSTIPRGDRRFVQFRALGLIHASSECWGVRAFAVLFSVEPDIPHERVKSSAMNWVATSNLWGQSRHWGRVAGVGLLALGLTMGCQASQNSVEGGADSDILQIWWSEGYYPEETEAIRNAVASWEAESGLDAELVFYSEKDLIQQTESAIAAGNPPDVIYGYSLDFAVIPRLAWEGKLADVTDVVGPLEGLYSSTALESVYYQNQQDNIRSYYAVPISQQTTHIHYWASLLEDAGKSADAIPTDWEGFWAFWSDAQVNLREATNNTNLFALGLPMSTAATDTSYLIEQFLDAYNVTLVSPAGDLLVDNPEVRAGIIRVLEEYTQFYRDGQVPPNAIDWSDPDNNVTFLSRLTLMTVNPSMSIPGSQRQDAITYNEQMVTIPWPSKPDGSSLRSLISTKQVAILADSPQLEEAKSFLSYLIQPEVLSQYIEGAQGRFFPVMPSMLESDFWTNEDDPHTVVAATQFTDTRPFDTVYNPAYSQVQKDSIWGQAVRKIVIDGVPPEEAADEAIAAIKQIFTEWE